MDDRHFTSGNVFSLACGAGSWLSKKQVTVALSTTEAEYLALSAATQEQSGREDCWQTWENLQRDQLKYVKTTKGLFRWPKIPCHARTKHIHIRHHFVRERVQDGAIALKYISTEEMIADILTKPLPKHRFEKLVARHEDCQISNVKSGSVVIMYIMI